MVAVVLSSPGLKQVRQAASWPSGGLNDFTLALHLLSFSDLSG